MTQDAAQLRTKSIGDSTSSFVMVEWEDGGESNIERPVAPLHIHHGGEEAWYVLEGTLGVRVGDEVHTVRPGAAVVAPRGTPHTFWNAGDTPCRYIVVMSPEINDLIKSLHSGSRDRASLEALFEQHQSELL